MLEDRFVRICEARSEQGFRYQFSQVVPGLSFVAMPEFSQGMCSSCGMFENAAFHKAGDNEFIFGEEANSPCLNPPFLTGAKTKQQPCGCTKNQVV